MKNLNRWMTVFLVIAGLLAMLNGCVPSGGGTGGATGEIEAEYAQKGPYATTSTSAPGYLIYYPRQMDGDHPIITWGNGTGAPTLSYTGLLNHLASWGFVVIASNSVMTQTGQALIGGIDYLIEQNKTPGSPFYGKLDTAHIGSTGHSQGGGGAINAATDPRVTCSAPIAPSPGRIGQVKGPIFLVAGSSDFIVSASLVRSTSYSMAKAPTVFGIASGMGHMNFVGSAGMARGYITAWFMYHLQADPVAGQAFTGDCEICENPNWTVSKKNF
jgi:dienelactone hydrolase